MTLRLHDTAAREKRVFRPQDPKRITVYVCGPTVYNYAHIGNARPPIVFDVLRRLLLATYGPGSVVFARNITDIEDKIIKAAIDTGQPIAAITKKYADIYNADMAALNVLPPTVEPWATDHVAEMIAMIENLVRKKYAYVGKDGVWFSVAAMSDYGKLSGRKPEDNEAGARVEPGEDKRAPADFALWKFAKPGEPEDAIWDSPWGRGRPGWHIECSAMAEKHLGRTLDIHAGGIDLQFPHHENEIAQSECAHGEVMANYWLHNGFLDMGGEKMSKSLGNVVLVHDLLKEWPGEVIRFAMLSGHYRAPLDWTPELLKQAKTTLDRIYGALRRVWDAEGGRAVDQGVQNALADDINTPLALSVLSGLASAANSAADARNIDMMATKRAELLAAGELLGLLQSHPEKWFGGIPTTIHSKAQKLLKMRTEARNNRNWVRADEKRLEMQRLWIDVRDGASPPLSYTLREQVMSEVFAECLKLSHLRDLSFKKELQVSLPTYDQRFRLDELLRIDGVSVGIEYRNSISSIDAKKWLARVREQDVLKQVDHLYYVAPYEGLNRNFSVGTIYEFQTEKVGLAVLLGTREVLYLSDPFGFGSRQIHQDRRG